MRKGFTIIEVLIATAIASLISVALFSALLQTMHYQRTTDTLVDVHTRAAIFQNQFEQDLMGFFVPAEAYELVSTKTTGAVSKEKSEQIDKVFYATANKDQFGILSFITDHAMQVYWGETIGAPKPLVARVLYKATPVKDAKDVFTITRQESRDLDFGHFDVDKEKSKIRAYDIVNDVKSMKVTYLARVYKAEDKKGASIDSARTGNEAKNLKKPDSSSARPEALEGQVKKVPSWTYKEFHEWDWSPKKTKSKDKSKDEKSKEIKAESKEKVSRVPFYIKIDLVLWDAQHTREVPFTFVFARKPFETVELENDTSPFEQKQAQMPSIKPVLDILNLPGLGGVGAGKPAATPQVVGQNVPKMNVDGVQKISVPNLKELQEKNVIAGKSGSGINPALAKLIPKT